MRKKITSLLLAAAMVLGLTACSSNDSTNDNTTTTANADTSAANADTTAEGGNESSDNNTSGESVTLKWALWDKDSTAYWKAMADGYTSTHPNVTIEMVDLGSDSFMTALTTQLAGGNGELDILSIKDIPGYANLINLEMLEPMNNNLNRPASDFGGVIDQLTAADGNFYGVPIRSDFWVVYYNKDLFDQAGVPYPTNDMTFEEYDALCRQMTSGSGAEKVYGGHYHTWRSTVSLFGILDGQHSIIDGTYDFLKPTYEMALAQQNDGIVMDYGELKTSGLHYSAAFENGQCAMVNMGSWFIATLQNYNAEAAANGVEPINFGIVKYPHPEGAAAGTTLGTVTSLGVNAYSENKEAAVDFINWCVSDEGAEIIAKTGTFPAVSNPDISNIIASTEGFPADDASKEALNTSAVYLEMPLTDKASEIETVLNAEHDAIMIGAESIDEGIANMNEQVQAILNG